MLRLAFMICGLEGNEFFFINFRHKHNNAARTFGFFFFFWFATCLVKFFFFIYIWVLTFTRERVWSSNLTCEFWIGGLDLFFYFCTSIGNLLYIYDWGCSHRIYESISFDFIYKGLCTRFKISFLRCKRIYNTLIKLRFYMRTIDFIRFLLISIMTLFNLIMR